MSDIAGLRCNADRKPVEAALNASERRFRLLLEGLPQLVWTCLPDGRCDYLSRQWIEYTGVPEEQQLAYGWSEFVHPDDLPMLLEQWQKAIVARGQFDEEVRLRKWTGEYRWFKTRAVLIELENDGEKWFGTSTDIHDRRLAEQSLLELNASLEQRVEERAQALRESEQKFRAIFHSQFQFIGLISPTGVVLEANRAALAAAGVPEASVIGKPFWETVWWTHDPAQQDRLRDAVRRAAQGERVRFEASHPTAAGTMMWVDFSLTPFADEHGRVILLIPEGRDITERRRAEDALRLQEALFRSAFDHAPIGMALVAPDGRWLRVNRSLCEIVGYSEAELLATNFQTITHPDDVDASLDHVRRMLDGLIQTCQMEKRYFHKQGHDVHILLSVSLVRDRESRPLYFIAQIKDITQRKKTERAVREKTQILQTVLESMGDAVLVTDQAGNILLRNQAFHRLHERPLEPGPVPGWSREYGVYLPGGARLCPADDLPIARAMRGEPTDDIELEIVCEQHPGGVPISVTGRPLTGPEGVNGGVIVIRDVSARRRAEERIKASLREKDVLLKEVHHRVKNNLQIVSALLDLQSDHTTDPDALEMFKESRGRVKSMALIHEWLYRSQDLARVDFVEYVRRLADAQYHAYRVSDGDIRMELDVDVPPFPIDVAIPCGLLLNELMSNCFKHAFRDAREGCIRVSLRQADQDTNALVVSDDGTGFPADIDFRNTTSFGLQLVNTLVEQLNGDIELSTGRGSRFDIRFGNRKC